MVEVEICSVKNTPLCKINAETSWSIAKLKEAIAKQKPKLTVHRQSLRKELKGKDLNNQLLLSAVLTNGNKIFVKDLGPQIAWTTVFLAEYAGPLFVYSIFALQPSIIYGESKSELSTVAFVAWICWVVHYSKRILETIFVHRFSHGTMPLFNLFKNCGYYWGFAAYVSYHVNHPLFTPPMFLQFVAGVGIFAWAELGNLSIHLLLRDLRPPGTTVRKIPVPNSNPLTMLFNYVSCPNYTYEYLAWIGFTVMTSCIPAFVFAAAGMFQMTLWALGKHKNYKKEFPNYPKNRKAILPFLL